MIACGLSDGQMAGFDLRDQLTFEFGFELSTNLSHYEYPAPHPRAATIGGREGSLLSAGEQVMLRPTPGGVVQVVRADQKSRARRAAGPRWPGRRAVAA